MKYKHNYQIGLEDVDIKGNATNRALMTMMEDIGGLHSDSVGYGLDSVERTGQAWVVLDWKIEIIKRPHYRDEITAYTWSRNHNIACAYRDFELFDTQGEKLARATSRWVLIDIVKRRPLRLTQELIEKYQGEPQSQAFEEDIRRELAFLQYAPILFASALTKQRVNRLADMVKFVAEQQHMRVSTSVLNELLEDAQLTNPPPAKGGKLLRIYYMTQASVQPPTFILFVNEPRLMHFSYVRFLENRLRETFGFEGTPIRLILRGKREADAQ